MSRIDNIAAASAIAPGVYQFGLSQPNISAALRTLADGIDAGIVLVQDVRHITRAAPDDFVAHTIVIRFATKGGPA